MCERELRCATAWSGSGGGRESVDFDFDACQTHESGDLITCSCERLGLMAVLEQRFLPKTNWEWE